MEKLSTSFAHSTTQSTIAAAAVAAAAAATDGVVGDAGDNQLSETAPMSSCR